MGNIAVPPTLNFVRELLIFTRLMSVDDSIIVLSIILVVYSIITILYRLIIYTTLHHGGMGVHVCFIRSQSIYYSSSFLLLVPAYILTFCVNIILFSQSITVVHLPSTEKDKLFMGKCHI